MEDYMKLNKKVIDSITVCGLCAMLTITAVTNSGRSEVKAEDKVALHDDSSSESERTVEPCRHDGTSVHLSVELHDTSLAVDLCMRLDAECG